MATLEENINQAIADFDDIEAAIIEQGVEVPDGTDTKEYGNLVRSIKSGGGGSVPVDQEYNPESTNAQSGVAVAQALAGLPIKYVTSDSSNPVYLREMESGTYVLYGKFKPFNGSTGTCTFSTGMLVSIIKTTAMTYVQVFYSKSNTIQYLEITDDTYERKDAKLINMESTANLTTTVDENSDDTHYPSAKAVWDSLELKRIESLDTENMKYMRDIESGYYIMHGYFEPFPNSNTTVIMDTMCVSVVRVEEGSHLMAFSPLNFKIRCYEILVDDTAEEGFVFNSWTINLLDLLEQSQAMVTTIDESSDDIHYPSAKAVWDSLEVKRIESLDKQNPLYFRDIESGYYIFHGYFRPYPNSPSFITMDTMYVSVARLDEGSHLMSISPLNFRITCYEILVDDTAEDGFTYSSKRLNLLELQELSGRVDTIENTLKETPTETTLKDKVTGQNYKLYIENGKLSMEVIE